MQSIRSNKFAAEKSLSLSEENENAQRNSFHVEERGSDFKQPSNKRASSGNSLKGFEAGEEKKSVDESQHLGSVGKGQGGVPTEDTDDHLQRFLGFFGGTKPDILKVRPT